MCYELPGKFPNFTDWLPQEPSLISKIRELRKLANCSLREALAALFQADEPRFGGDVLLSLAAIRGEGNSRDLSARWRKENPARDRLSPIPQS